MKNPVVFLYLYFFFSTINFLWSQESHETIMRCYQFHGSAGETTVFGIDDVETEASPDQKNNHKLFFDQLIADCGYYLVKISGNGLGIKFTDKSDMILRCSRKNPEGSYSGAKFSLGIYYGVQAAKFYSHGDYCALNGFETQSWGLSVSYGRLEIVKK